METVKPGKLILLEIIKEKRRKKGKYLCFCGKEFTTRLENVDNGRTKSCGCFKNHLSRKRKTTHGGTNTRLYRIWKNIKARCHNSNNRDYYNYGKRGITMYAAWMNNFAIFERWALDNGYREDLTIDRKDNDLGYTPDNCRFVDRTVQSLNRRKSKRNKSGYKGVTPKRGKWHAKISYKYKSVHIGTYNTLLEAVVAYNEKGIELFGDYFIPNPLPPHNL